MHRLFGFLALVATSVTPVLDAPPVCAAAVSLARERSAFTGRLKADRTALRDPGGKRFAWRGLTSFRLVEQTARGRSADVGRYLEWAAANGVTIVRVLAMTKHLFELTPADGRAALPRLLSAARARGLYVEIVALADTRAYDLNLDQHVRAIGEIAAEHENAIVEIANEPDHPTQRKELADARRLLALARLVPPEVPVALGTGGGWQDPLYGASVERPNTFLTAHFPRSDGDRGWGSHLSLRAALRLQTAYQRFVVDDEPIGAGDVAVQGSRDPEPVRWFGHGLLARMLAIGSTFHSDAGLQAAIPEGTERACFDAWRQGMLFFPPDLGERAIVRDAGDTTPDDPADAPVASFDRARAVGAFSVVDGSRGWAVAFGVSAGTQASTGEHVRIREPWRVTRTEPHGPVLILHLAR